MATITKNNTFSAGATIVASEHNDNFDTIYNDYNTNITNVNISASAAIVDTKLATLTTASKVNLSALVITSQAAGDVIYASSATALTRLAAGTSGNFLQSVGTAAPIWTNLDEADMPTGVLVAVSNTMDGSVATGTTNLPDDDTIPQGGEGDQFMSLSHTPAVSANRLKVDVVAELAASTAGAEIGAFLLSNPSTAAATSDAIAAVKNVAADSTSGLARPTMFSHFYTAATTAQITFYLRVGSASGATITFNGEAGSRRYGGAMASSITVTEFAG